jgi:cytochrome c-type biogenesis protein
MTGVSAVALLAAFAAGIVSFLSPCVLPLVPGYVSYVSGQSLGRGEGENAASNFAPFWLSMSFVLGFSTVFIVLGASATAVGRLLLAYKNEANLVAGAIVIVFGLVTIDVVRWRWLLRDFHPGMPGGQTFSAYVRGLAFALGWTPCIGPIPGVILTTSAVSTALLTAYSLGLGLPFLVTALFTDRLVCRLKRLGLLGRMLQIGAGGVMVAMGVAMVTGQLSAFSYWLLETSRSSRGSDEDEFGRPSFEGEPT